MLFCGKIGAVHCSSRCFNTSKNVHNPTNCRTATFVVSAELCPAGLGLLAAEVAAASLAAQVFYKFSDTFFHLLTILCNMISAIPNSEGKNITYLNGNILHFVEL